MRTVEGGRHTFDPCPFFFLRTGSPITHLRLRPRRNAAADGEVLRLRPQSVAESGVRRVVVGGEQLLRS